MALRVTGLGPPIRRSLFEGGTVLMDEQDTKQRPAGLAGIPLIGAIPDEARELSAHMLRQAARQYARAKAERVYLEQYRRIVLAERMKHYAEVRGPAGAQPYKSQAAQEREAYADPAYVEVIRRLRDATEREELLRLEIREIELSIEVWRTREANQRAEARMH